MAGHLGDHFLPATTLALPVIGFLVAIAMTVRRSTRRVGQGMLMGLALMLPAAVVIDFAYFISRL